MTSRAYYITTIREWRKELEEQTFQVSHWLRIAASESLPEDADEILVLVEADEGAHAFLEALWLALPHPVTQEPIHPNAAAKLAVRGIQPGAKTLDVSKMAGELNPLMKWR